MSAKNFAKLEHPIDVMPLMHKAFRAMSARTEALAAQASTIEDTESRKGTTATAVATGRA